MDNHPSNRVAVVILNWNGIHHLQTYLPSVIQSCAEDAEIWVVDNGSTDESVVWLKSTHKDSVQVLELAKNFGFAEGYNQALRTISADMYVLLNSDVRMESPVVPKVVQIMQENNWSVASPMMVQDVNPDVCEHAGAAGGWIDRDGYPFCIGRVFDNVDHVDEWHQQNREVFWASGACFFITQEAWKLADGFDGSLFAHMEEIDLCWRIKNLGMRVGCVGEVAVRHLGGGTLKTASPFKTYLNFRNNLVILLKNKPGIWPIFMFRRMALDGVAALTMAMRGQWRQFLAVGRAHGAFYLRIPKVLRQRVTLRRNKSTSPNDTGLWHRSIVWARFIQGKKSALELDLSIEGRRD